MNRLTSEGASSLLAVCLPPWLVQHFTPTMAQAQYKCAIRVRDAVMGWNGRSSVVHSLAESTTLALMIQEALEWMEANSLAGGFSAVDKDFTDLVAYSFPGMVPNPDLSRGLFRWQDDPMARFMFEAAVVQGVWFESF